MATAVDLLTDAAALAEEGLTGPFNHPHVLHLGSYLEAAAHRVDAGADVIALASEALDEYVANHPDDLGLDPDLLFTCVAQWAARRSRYAGRRAALAGRLNALLRRSA
ncbi:hypothetical protein GCM10009682_48700 [Luedemannella flava]|uniref:Uncharacterized protein n=1 Tax=Luedemannella flava TaxID=349316 RepID=A0ABN2MFL3_9ACTN